VHFLKVWVLGANCRVENLVHIAVKEFELLKVLVSLLNLSKLKVDERKQEVLGLWRGNGFSNILKEVYILGWLKDRNDKLEEIRIVVILIY